MDKIIEQVKETIHCYCYSHSKHVEHIDVDAEVDKAMERIKDFLVGVGLDGSDIGGY